MSEPSATVAVTPTKKSSLQYLLIVMVVLAITAVIVYRTLPKPVEYVPSPGDLPKVKSVAEVKANMETIKASNKVPPGEKSRILGFLAVELEQAKAREAKVAPAK